MARRPQQLNDFVGQRRLIKLIRQLVIGCRTKDRALPWLAITGRPGMGKSALAAAIARDYAKTPTGEPLTNFHELIGGKGLMLKVVETLRLARATDILFLDEAHALDLETQEVLYLALDQNRTFALAEGRVDRGRTESIRECSVILATTEPGKLSKPLLSRVSLIELDPYTTGELKEIALRVAKARGIELTPQAARHLVERTDRTPRGISKTVELLEILCAPATDVSVEDVRSKLTAIGIDEQGLTVTQRVALQHLATVPRASRESLAIQLGVDAKHVRRDVEPRLIELGLIEVAPQGLRSISDHGRCLVQAWASAEVANAEATGEPPGQNGDA